MLNRFSKNPGVLDYSGHVTPNFLRTKIVPLLAECRIHTFFFDDFARIEPRYRAAVLEIVQQVMDGKVVIGQHELNTSTKVHCGMVISCTDRFWCGNELQRQISDLGIDNRVLTVFFENSRERQSEISRAVLNGNSLPSEISVEKKEFEPLRPEFSESIPQRTIHARQQLQLARLLKMCPQLPIFEFIRPGGEI